MARSLPIVLLVACSLLTPAAIGQDGRPVDLAMLKSNGVADTTDDLLQFFRRRVPDPATRTAAEKWLTQWANGGPVERTQAAHEIVALGPAVLPVLKQARMTAPADIVPGIEQCIQKITSAESSELIVAVARALAARQASSAIDLLLAYQPFAGDPWVQDELLYTLADLSVRDGKVDPHLIAALKGPAPQRGLAAYVLATSGGFTHRAAVRQFFVDGDAGVRHLAAAGLVGKATIQQVRDSAINDETLLRNNNVPADTASLFAFLKSRLLDDAEQEQVKKLIRDLGDRTYVVRARAFDALAAKGTAIQGFLRDAQPNVDLEVSRRVTLCMDEILRGPGPTLPVAVIRRLASDDPNPRAPAGEIIRILLDYIPFAEDDSVEEEVLKALSIVAARETSIDPLLTQALADSRAARRGAAAYVLGRVGTEDQQPALAALLHDANPTVRFRAAQGLLAGMDARAVPALVALLDQPDDLAWQAEELLQRLAAESAPVASVQENPETQRKLTQKLWQEWQQQYGSQIAWSRLQQGASHMGLVTIAEYESARGRPGGRVWERGADGVSRWQFTAYGAMDAQVLQNGRILIAENIDNRVSERDKKGEIKWQYAVPSNPVACQRLPNGNTFIATYNQLLEITPDRKVVYDYKRGPAFFIFSAQKTSSGKIVCMTAQGSILEIDARTGKELRTINVGPAGGWCGVEALPNGRFLVATMNDNMVREIDSAGKAVWSCQYPGVFRAARLPNGHTLVASMSTRKVAEFDRQGKMRWEFTCEGRPWSLRVR